MSESLCLFQSEAMRAFCAPEVLDGNNQFYCERCQAKRDAHKVISVLWLLFAAVDYVISSPRCLLLWLFHLKIWRPTSFVELVGHAGDARLIRRSIVLDQIHTHIGGGSIFTLIDLCASIYNLLVTYGVIDPLSDVINTKTGCAWCTVYMSCFCYIQSLKFITFPYLLTIHLLRFDFDYSTFRRIKLNHRFASLAL